MTQRAFPQRAGPCGVGHGAGVVHQKRAIVAVGRSILIIVWHLLSDPEARFHDLGPDFYDNRTSPERKKRNHIRQLEALGYKVTLEPAA
jgi:transposase